MPYFCHLVLLTPGYADHAACAVSQEGFCYISILLSLTSDLQLRPRLHYVKSRARALK